MTEGMINHAREAKTRWAYNKNTDTNFRVLEGFFAMLDENFQQCFANHGALNANQLVLRKASEEITRCVKPRGVVGV